MHAAVHPTPSAAALAERDRLLARVEEKLRQREFDWMVPEEFMRLTWLTGRQAAKMMGYDVRMVERIADEQILVGERQSGVWKLERYGPCDRKRTEWRYTLRGVVLYIVERLNSDPAEHLRRVERLLGRMDAAQLTRVIVFATERRAKL